MLLTLSSISIGLILALLLYGILLYNNLISLRNNVSKNWSNVDVLLKQRNSELPKLIETCKEYMQFEQDTLQKIVEARQATMSASKEKDMVALSIAETDLHSSLQRLFALAENYPDLKTNRSFMQLQNRISDLENAIADRRELYNDSVNLNNVRIEQFPDLIIAKLFHFKTYPLMQFQSSETEDIQVGASFKQKD